MFRRKGAHKAVEPPPPGQMTDPEYDEVSKVKHPANGHFFLVRKGLGTGIQYFTQKQLDEMKAAGLESPQPLGEAIKETLKHVLPEVLTQFPELISQYIKKGEAQPMDPQDENKPQADTRAVARGLDDSDKEIVREIAKEVASSLNDERFEQMQKQINDLTAANKQSEEAKAEIEKSIKEINGSISILTKDSHDVQKALEFRPAGQGDAPPGDTPPDPEKVQKQATTAGWLQILDNKQGAQ